MSTRTKTPQSPQDALATVTPGPYQGQAERVAPTPRAVATPGTRKPPPPTESQEQARVVAWLRANRIKFFSVPNGGKFGRNRRLAAMQMAKLKREGLQAGVPDLFITSRLPMERALSEIGAIVRGVFVEMKRVGSTDSDVSAEQRLWIRDLFECGFLVFVGSGADDAIRKLQSVGFGVRVATAVTDGPPQRAGGTDG